MLSLDMERVLHVAYPSEAVNVSALDVNQV